MLKRILAASAIAIGLISGVTTSASALSPNINFKTADRMTTISPNTNIRQSPCGTGDTTVGKVSKGVTGLYLGEKKFVTGTCRGLKDETWYKMVFTSPIPDGGTESVQGWVASSLINHEDGLRAAIGKNSTVRVNITSGYLNLRKASITGTVLAKLGKNMNVKVLAVEQAVKLNGELQNPVKIEVTITGIKVVGYVSSKYLVAYSPYD
jgi:hypothetical protein